MLILLTGATGYLGAAIAQRLGFAGVRVRLLVRDPGRLRLPPGAAVEVATADLTGAVDWPPLLAGVSAVCHAAGLAHVQGAGHPFQAVNADATRHLALASRAADVDRFVLVSSLSVYATEGEGTAATPYARSKALAEQAAAAAFSDAPARLVVLRFATVYGPGAPGNVTRLVRAIQRRRFFLLGKGGNRKCLLQRDDAAAAAVAALTVPAAPPTPATFDVTEPPRPMAEIVSAIGVAAGLHPPRFPLPDAGLRGLQTLLCRMPSPAARYGHWLERWMSEEVHSSEPLRAWCGWCPQHDFVAEARSLLAPAFSAPPQVRPA